MVVVYNVLEQETRANFSKRDVGRKNTYSIPEVSLLPNLAFDVCERKMFLLILQGTGTGRKGVNFFT